MVGNINYATPEPTVLVYDEALTTYSTKLAEVSAAEVALQRLRAERDSMRIILESNLNGRGMYVDRTSGGDLAKILSAAFEVQADASPTTSMEKPYDVSATMGDNPGEIDVSCHSVPKTRSYIIEVRGHSDTDVPGSWTLAKISGRSSATITGLASGMKYAFRIRALGPNDLESPWSDEAICMAP